MTNKEAIENLKRINEMYHVSWHREAINMAIEALKEVERHNESFEWCTDCKEYDKDNHCCHRWTKRIRDTIEDVKCEFLINEIKDLRRQIIDDIESRYNSMLTIYREPEYAQLLESVVKACVNSVIYFSNKKLDEVNK